MRSRVDNVQAALNNLIFVDPTQVSIPDLIDRNPHGVVRTLPGAKPGDGVFISQVPDVTKGHWGDITQLSELKQNYRCQFFLILFYRAMISLTFFF